MKPDLSEKKKGSPARTGGSGRENVNRCGRSAWSLEPKDEELCSKCAQKYLKPSKNIEIHRNPEGLGKAGFTG